MKTPNEFPTFGMVIDEEDVKWLNKAWDEIDRRTRESKAIYDMRQMDRISEVHNNNYKIKSLRQQLLDFYESKLSSTTGRKLRPIIEELKASMQ